MTEEGWVFMDGPPFTGHHPIRCCFAALCRVDGRKNTGIAGFLYQLIDIGSDLLNVKFEGWVSVSMMRNRQLFATKELKTEKFLKM